MSYGLAQSSLRKLHVLVLATAVGCASNPSHARRRAGNVLLPPDPATSAIRYRLPLRNNPVDPGDAFRCYGACQPQTTPRGYLECLSACPGFEVAEHEVCAKDEVPPVAACITVHKIPAKPEAPPAGLIVLAVVGSFLLVIGADALCASSKSQCGYPRYPYGY